MVITCQIREGAHYCRRILAVGQKNPDGALDCPVIDFFRQQDGHLDKLSALLEYTARKGPPSNREKFKAVEGTALFEFKAFQHRLLCFLDIGGLIVCTNGVVKKRDALPPEVVRIGLSWRTAYFNAKMNNTLRHEPEHQ
jgi:hypothetical protein